MARSHQQRRSRFQEKRMAEDLGGRVQAGSGSSWGAKGDVRLTGEVRAEAKYTEKDEYLVKLDELLKIRDEAIKGGLETPVMQVEFVQGPTSYKLAIMDYKLFRHWHGFSQDTTLHQQECWTAAKQFKLDRESARAFFAGATALKAHGVIQLIFDNSNWKRFFAVLEWDLFTTLHKEYDP